MKIIDKKIIREIFTNNKLKKSFLFTLFNFSFFLILGIMYALLNKEEALLVMEIFSEKYSFALDYGFWQMFLFILENNVVIAFLAFLSGIIFGLPTFFILVSNSFIIGLIIAVAGQEMSILMIASSIVPHGIFEIPAILLALSLGFFIGDSFFGFLFKKKKLKKDFIFSFKVFFILVAPLLFIAALVESFLIVVLK